MQQRAVAEQQISWSATRVDWRQALAANKVGCIVAFYHCDGHVRSWSWQPGPGGAGSQTKCIACQWTRVHS